MNETARNVSGIHIHFCSLLFSVWHSSVLVHFSSDRSPSGRVFHAFCFLAFSSISSVSPLIFKTCFWSSLCATNFTSRGRYRDLCHTQLFSLDYKRVYVYSNCIYSETEVRYFSLIPFALWNYSYTDWRHWPRLSPAQHSLTVQNRGLKHKSFYLWLKTSLTISIKIVKCQQTHS